MASGGAWSGTTRAGRKIKPTLKARAILAQTAYKIYLDAIQNVDNHSIFLYEQMDSKGTSHLVLSTYEDWNALYADLHEAEYALRDLIPVEEVGQHDAYFRKKTETYKRVRWDVNEYVRDKEETEEKRATTPEEYHLLRQESMSMDDEIQRLETEISKIELSTSFASDDVTQRETLEFTKTSKPAKVETSTPKAPAALSLSDNLDLPPKYDGRKDLLPQATVKNKIVKIKAKEEPFQPPKRPAMDQDWISWEQQQEQQLKEHQKKRVRTLKKEPPDKPREKEESTVAVLSQLAELIAKGQDKKKPKMIDMEPAKFSGDILKFPMWWNSFYSMVEQRAETNEEKLYGLERFTEGAAKECILGFLNFYDDDDAYIQAKKMLFSRFGNKVKIAEAYRKKINAWPNVKRNDTAGLRKYADFLWQCRSAMKTVNYLKSLNNPEENIKLAQKLPNYLIDRWNRIVDSYVYKVPDEQELDTTSGEYPSFTDFCQFLSGEARLAHDAHVPRHNERSEGGTGGYKKAPFQKTTLATGVSESLKKPFCFYCQLEHPLYKCRDFLGKSGDFKKEYARENHICFGCLNKGHMYRDCRIKDKSLMKDPHPQDPVPAAGKVMQVRSTPSVDFFSMIVPVSVHHISNPELKKIVYAVIDTQSDCCFMSDELAEDLGINSKPVELELTTMGQKCMLKSSMAYGLKVRGLTENTELAIPRCFTREEIPTDRETIPTPSKVSLWPHLKEVAEHLLPLKSDVKIGLLLGHNCPEVLFPPEEFVAQERNKPYGYHTILGWTVMGRQTPNDEEKNENPQKEVEGCKQVCFKTSVKEVTHQEINKVFDQDFIDPSTERFKKMSFEDHCFMETMEAGIIQRDDNHYELPLPFKEEPKNLPNNRSAALRRLMGLKRKLVKDDVLQQRYKDFMDAMFIKGQAEEVPAGADAEAGCFWYISHQGVYHPHKLDKLRVVFDCSADFLGYCLNLLLLAGPDQVNSLIGVLCRFRQEKHAFVCDIEGMFHQVYVTQKHRDYLRFLWFKKGDPNGEVVEYRMCVHLFGASSSPGCANFAFKHVADQYATTDNRDITQFIKKHFYVDDGLKSNHTLDECERIILGGHDLCKKGGFNLVKFQANSKELEERIPHEWIAKPKVNVEIKEPNAPIDRTLGLIWDRIRDVFLFVVKMIEKPETKRGMLSALSSVYDPLGLVSPLLLRGRRILQTLCVQKMGWDDQVEIEIAELWREWYNQLQKISEHSIPRCIRKFAEESIVRVQILTFADASTSGFGACCFLKLVDENGNVDINLMYAKSKVMPVKLVTIPRMELQAAVLGTKISCFLKGEIEYPEIQIEQHYWSDSKVVLGYLTNSSKKFQLYVANRVFFIRNNSCHDNWHHVASNLNPADVASRGCEAEELMKNQSWWHGPKFLKESHEYGELQDDNYEVQEDDPEVKKRATVLMTEGSVRNGVCFVTSRMCTLSSWKRMISVVCVWRRYMQILKARLQKEKLEPFEEPIVFNVQETGNARDVLVRLVQKHAYPEEYPNQKDEKYPTNRSSSKTRKRRMKNSDSNLYKLDVYMDEQMIMRVGGRLRRSTLPRELIHPCLLPGDHHFTKCIVQHYHNVGRHQGRGFTLNTLRAAGFWVTSGRTVVERYIKKCPVCKALRGPPMKQKMSNLPKDRMETAPPFSYVGVDFFGPFYVKCGRCQRKRWGCIFTCLCCRAVHVEIAHSMDTSSFINAYRRFVARRGPCRLIRCDCGTNFKGAQGELESALAEMSVSQIKQELAKENCDMIPFKFNFPKSSHMGGAWERMIKLIRDALNYLLSVHGDSLDDELLLTLMTEAEAIVNSRPLTYVDMTRPDQPPLTPAQLTTMKTALILPPPGEFVREDLYARKRWRRVQFLANQFWYRWRKEYISQLQERSKWMKTYGNLQVDDVVLVIDENLPRNKWLKALVETVYRGDDGLVRKATVKTKDGTYDRPIHKLVFIHREETG